MIDSHWFADDAKSTPLLFLYFVDLVANTLIVLVIDTVNKIVLVNGNS